jgi:hypothetical protein
MEENDTSIIENHERAEKMEGMTSSSRTSPTLTKDSEPVPNPNTNTVEDLKNLLCKLGAFISHVRNDITTQLADFNSFFRTQLMDLTDHLCDHDHEIIHHQHLLLDISKDHREQLREVHTKLDDALERIDAIQDRVNDIDRTTSYVQKSTEYTERELRGYAEEVFELPFASKQVFDPPLPAESSIGNTQQNEENQK